MKLTLQFFDAVGEVTGSMHVARTPGHTFLLEYEIGRAVTVSFCTLVSAQLWHVFNMRADASGS